MKQKHIKALIASLELGADKEAPEWVLLFAEGMNSLADGSSFLVNRNSYDLLVAHQQDRGVDIVWDYEHQTVTNEKAPASGWCKEFRYTAGRGIEVRVEWTEEAAGYIARSEYRYFSPVFYTRKSDDLVVGLHSVALTNTPKTNNLEPLLAKLGAEYNHQTEQEETMEFWKKMIAKLGLPADAGESQVIAAMIAKLGIAADSAADQVVDAIVAKLDVDTNQEMILAKAEVPAGILGALDLESGDTSAVVASINAIKQNEKGMVSQADFNKLQAKLTDRDANEAVAEAIKAGKVTPDQKEWATNYAKTDLDGFNLFVSKAAVVVPLKDLPGGKTIADQQTIDQTTLTVAKLFGNSEDDLKKHGGMG